MDLVREICIGATTATAARLSSADACDTYFFALFGTVRVQLRYVMFTMPSIDALLCSFTPLYFFCRAFLCSAAARLRFSCSARFSWRTLSIQALTSLA